MKQEQESGDHVPVPDDENTEKPIICQELGRLIDEASALAIHVARHGASETNGDKSSCNKLFKAIADAKTKPSEKHWQTLMEAYNDVAAITYKKTGVNGRTILDTQSKAAPYICATRNRPVVVGVFLFLCALILEVLIDCYGRVSDPIPPTETTNYLYFLVGTLSTFLVPAVWGGIGACVFLTKRISDKLFEMAYEEARLRGAGTRIFLGSMLGVVVVVLFFPNFGEQIRLGEVNLGPATAAFIAGLGVKPVYAAFESLSEGLSQRFKGSKGNVAQ